MNGVDFYENLIKENRLIILPCPLGSEIWILLKHCRKWVVRPAKLSWNTVEKAIMCIGKTVFLTEEEAIEKRDELNGTVNVRYFRSN